MEASSKASRVLGMVRQFKVLHKEFSHYLQWLYQTSLGICYTSSVTLPTQRYRLPEKKL